ncbi:MAG: phosphatidylglycerol lysyltransferase domain-containing protein [Patescibacteria group bacterium]|nr:phosphatidylglycerol lysyltransferase domain-containing protein [Patescibacteria group bacterium]
MKISKPKYSSNNFEVRLISLFVLFNGIYLVGSTLIRQLIANHRFADITYFSNDLNLIVALSLIYLASLLARRKKSAFYFSIVAYTIYFLSNIENYLNLSSLKHIGIGLFLRELLIPVIILLLLLLNRPKFVVKSDIQSFKTAVQLSLLLIVIVGIFGTAGFIVLGKSGFHRNLSILTAVHYTFDQVNLTTNKPLHVYSPKAQLFTESLRIISVFSLIYVFLLFFKPIKDKYSSRTNLERFRNLLYSQEDSRSEDFFKIWPEDKNYFFDQTRTSGLGYRVNHRNALVLGGPTGKRAKFRQLLVEFNDFCKSNDWTWAVIHTEHKYFDIYESLGFKKQLIGKEAIVDLDNFIKNQKEDKYFRNILNRFNSRGYSYSLIKPPHETTVLLRLKQISDQWLRTKGHVERGFAMGWFNFKYINLCDLIVAKDNQGIIQGFVNIIPAPYDKTEATYDLMRSTKEAAGNVNDFLVLSLINELKHQGYKRLNMGLCPLVGVNDEKTSDSQLINGLLKLAYANGNHFYSFNGLYRFKNKYYPKWRSRYILYRGGITQFSKINRSLMLIMRKSASSKRF